MKISKDGSKLEVDRDRLPCPQRHVRSRRRPGRHRRQPGILDPGRPAQLDQARHVLRRRPISPTSPPSPPSPTIPSAGSSTRVGTTPAATRSSSPATNGASPKTNSFTSPMARHRCMHILPEEVNGQMQGGAVRFPWHFNSGSMRARFNPVDGQLYVCGFQGWQTNAKEQPLSSASAIPAKNYTFPPLFT